MDKLTLQHYLENLQRQVQEFHQKEENGTYMQSYYRGYINALIKIRDDLFFDRIK